VGDGDIVAEARLTHGGRTTQVCDATVTAASGRALARFRCTQLLLDPARKAKRR
jgi:acyl-coenzyme A thioesterase PaaI-like protein